MVGPNVVLEWTVATADMELRGAARNLRLSGLAGVKGHHNRSREAPNRRERRTPWSCRCSWPLRRQTGW